MPKVWGSRSVKACVTSCSHWVKDLNSLTSPPEWWRGLGHGPTAGNAQCTFDCVNVTRTDGSVFYPAVSRNFWCDLDSGCWFGGSNH